MLALSPVLLTSWLKFNLVCVNTELLSLIVYLGKVGTCHTV